MHSCQKYISNPVCHLSRPVPKKMLLYCSCTQYLADFLIFPWHKEQYWCVIPLSALKLSQCVAFSTEHLLSLMVSGSDDSQLVLWWVRASASLSEGFYANVNDEVSFIFKVPCFLDNSLVWASQTLLMWSMKPPVPTKFNCCPYTSTSVCLGQSTLFLSATSGF